MYKPYRRSFLEEVLKIICHVKVKITEKDITSNQQGKKCWGCFQSLK